MLSCGEQFRSTQKCFGENCTFWYKSSIMQQHKLVSFVTILYSLFVCGERYLACGEKYKYEVWSHPYWGSICWNWFITFCKHLFLHNLPKLFVNTWRYTICQNSRLQDFCRRILNFSDKSRWVSDFWNQNWFYHHCPPICLVVFHCVPEGNLFLSTSADELYRGNEPTLDGCCTVVGWIAVGWEPQYRANTIVFDGCGTAML